MPARVDKAAVPQHWYFCLVAVPVPIRPPIWFLALNVVITADEVSHCHLLCPSKNVFWKSH